MFSQGNWSLLSFDEKNRKIRRTKKRQMKMQGRPFTGQLMHLPGVSCDNFSGENRNNDQFFLSHCHTGNRITYVQTYWPFLHDTKKCQSGYWVYTLKAYVSQKILNWHGLRHSHSAELWIIFLCLACLSQHSQ